MFGYKDEYEYYYNNSSSHVIPQIRKPTLFFNALDDPIIGDKGIDFEGIKNNPFTVLATSNHGGHMGYNEGVLTLE